MQFVLKISGSVLTVCVFVRNNKSTGENISNRIVALNKKDVSNKEMKNQNGGEYYKQNGLVGSDNPRLVFYYRNNHSEVNFGYGGNSKIKRRKG